MSDPSRELQILQGIQDKLIGETSALTIQLTPVLFFPNDNSLFPALSVYEPETQLVQELANEVIDLDYLVNIDCVVALDQEDLLVQAKTLAAEVQTVMIREAQKRPPFGLDFVERISTIGGASTQDADGRFPSYAWTLQYEIRYRTTYGDLIG